MGDDVPKSIHLEKLNQNKAVRKVIQTWSIDQDASLKHLLLNNK
jgi:hypothetical protein